MLKIVGFECGYPVARNNRRIDEFEKTHHYDHFAIDFIRAKDAGAEALRWGPPWHKVEPEEGVYDWHFADEAIECIRLLKMELFLDLCHFGTPDWLLNEGGFLSPRFPEVFTRWCVAVAERYPHIKFFNLINEPTITARVCGRDAAWHPFRTDGFQEIIDNLVSAYLSAHAAVKELRPDAVFMQNDTCERHFALSDCQLEKVQQLSDERFYFWDKTIHCVDIIGLDYYPWSEVSYHAEHTRGHSESGFCEIAKDYWNRYGKPILLAETDAAGDYEHRAWWMEKTVSDCRELKAAGVEVVGYTWWPFLDNLNWGGWKESDTPDNAGLYDLQLSPCGKMKRLPTPLVDKFKLV